MSFPGPRTYQLLRQFHKYAGLAAALWLFVLGVTGFLLDHHEYRWLNQNSVPAHWTSERVARLVPGTVMRHIAVEGEQIVGASERGAWFSDGGDRWSDIAFEGLGGQPQVTGIADLGGAGFQRVYLASDDGLWSLSEDGLRASRLGLGGQHLTSISAGHGDNDLLIVAEKSGLIAFGLDANEGRALAIEANVSGLTPQVKFHRFIMDLHFGRALLPGNWGIWLNDLGGIAMAVLSLSGVLYWFVTRRGRRKFMSMKAQRGWMRWMFRLHAPTLGLLGLVPILYLSVTALPLNHIYGFLEWSDGKAIDRSALPSSYNLTSFDHEIDGAVAWPGEEGRLTIATDQGLLESRDNGKSWAVDLAVPVEDGAPGANLFRHDKAIFAGFGGGRNYAYQAGGSGWQALEGTSTAITAAAGEAGDVWVKNSQAIYRGASFDGALTDSGIDFRSAAPGTTLFLFLVDVHVGLVIHSEFKWANDVFALLALILALSGPIMWLRRKWI